MSTILFSLIPFLIGVWAKTGGDRKDKFVLNDPHLVLDSCGCGHVAEKRPESWLVYIYILAKNPNDYEGICCGIVISSNQVLTSYMCLRGNGRRRGMETLFVSSKLRASLPSEGYTFSRELLQSKYQKSWDNFPYRHGMILVLDGVDFTQANSTIRPICLPTMEELANITQLNLYTYGLVVLDVYYLDNHCLETHTDMILPEDDGKTRVFYKKKDVAQRIDNSVCKESIQSWEKQNEHQHSLCARFQNKGLVNLDFAPLVATTAGGKEILVGFSSNVSAQMADQSILRHYATLSDTDMNNFLGIAVNYYQAKLCKREDIEMKQRSKQKPPIQETLKWDEEAGGEWDKEEMVASIKREVSLEHCTCGLLNPKPDSTLQSRIVGGADAVPYEFGWIVYMISKEGSCTGSAINDRVILTAAHCVLEMQYLPMLPIAPEEFTILLRVHNRTFDPQYIKKRVKQVIFHPGFVKVSGHGMANYDIAMLELADPLEFASESNDGIRPICLPKVQGNPPKKMQGIIAGYGLMNDSNPESFPDVLQKASIEFWSQEECHRHIRSYEKCRVYKGNICTLGLKACGRGDSGGPFITNGTDGRWTQYGTCSWGEAYLDRKQHVEEIISVYINTHAYVNFINYISHLVGAKWCKE